MMADSSRPEHSSSNDAVPIRSYGVLLRIEIPYGFMLEF
jgi:hypothetical protein